MAHLKALGVHAAYHPGDLRHPEQIASMMDAAAHAFGAVDALVNNAVVRQCGAMENFVPEHWDEALAVNLAASFHTIRLALLGMTHSRLNKAESAA